MGQEAASCSVFRTYLLKIHETTGTLRRHERVLFTVSVPFTEQVRPRHGGKRSQERIMDVLKMLSELRSEREQIEEAIMTLERLARGRGKRRGRPPAWLSALKRRGRPPGSKNKPKEAAA
jgi:hypothetical protein